MIIGVTGTLAAGKDTVAQYLQKKGFFHFSLSDAIREEADKRGLAKDRDTLQVLGVELRSTLGNDILARRAMAAVKTSGSRNAALTSIRHPDDIKFLRTQPDFVLINLDAPIAIRYERVSTRMREGDQVDFATFQSQEEREMTGTGSAQNITAVAALADCHIQNDGTFADLYRKIDEIIDKAR